jgi:hypothetical protein
VDDVAIEETPIEEVIGDIFSTAAPVERDDESS